MPDQPHEHKDPQPAPDPPASDARIFNLPTSSIPDFAYRPSSSLGDPSQDRASFTTEELALVLSHYDLGVIRTIREFRRGSRRSPKLLIGCEKGAFILKRRAPARADTERVRFSHAIQNHLARRGFPLPRLLPTRNTETTAITLESGVYELFEFIKGTPYDLSLQATYQAGQALAVFHRLLADFHSDYSPPIGSYHAADAVLAQLRRIPHRVADPGLQPTIDFLSKVMEHAHRRAEDAGLPNWPVQIIHGDWHPGNMLYSGSKVVAVIDYDTAHAGQRVLDIANGALQFSITRGEGPPEAWPDYLDESRLKRFGRGYDSVDGCTISTGELKALPWLMIEALITEAAIPIATTGRFASIDGKDFLLMLERKIRWLQQQADHIVGMFA